MISSYNINGGYWSQVLGCCRSGGKVGMLQCAASLAGSKGAKALWLVSLRVGVHPLCAEKLWCLSLMAARYLFPSDV